MGVHSMWNRIGVAVDAFLGDKREPTLLSRYVHRPRHSTKRAFGTSAQRDHRRAVAKRVSRRVGVLVLIATVLKW